MLQRLFPKKKSIKKKIHKTAEATRKLIGNKIKC